MPFYNSRNSNFVMKFRRNRDIDLYKSFDYLKSHVIFKYFMQFWL